jgi:Holliday junction resolvase RusA-like endonuclease
VAHAAARNNRRQAVSNKIIKISVNGTPATKGSSQSYAARNKAGVYTGRIGYRPDSDALGAWQDAVRTEGQRAMDGRAPIEGPVCVLGLVVRFNRPATHYRTGKFAGQLRDDAPEWPVDGSAAKDIDKLVRAIFDGLQTGGVIKDDKQIVMMGTVMRVYCAPGEPQGADIWLTPALAKPPRFWLSTLGEIRPY